MRAPALGNDNARAAAQADKQPHQQIDKASWPPPPPAHWCPQSCRQSAYPPCCTAAGTAYRTRWAERTTALFGDAAGQNIRLLDTSHRFLSFSVSRVPILCYNGGNVKGAFCDGFLGAMRGRRTGAAPAGDTPAPPCPALLAVCPLWRSAPTALRKSLSGPGRNAPAPTPTRSPAILWRKSLLPDTVRVLHSAAFYNCRKLRQGTLGLGWNPRAAICSRTAANYGCLRCGPQRTPHRAEKLLGAVSADITAELDGARLFYPEYSEFWTRTPPRIFSITALRARATGCGSALRPAAQ